MFQVQLWVQLKTPSSHKYYHNSTWVWFSVQTLLEPELNQQFGSKFKKIVRELDRTEPQQHYLSIVNLITPSIETLKYSQASAHQKGFVTSIFTPKKSAQPEQQRGLEFKHQLSFEPANEKGKPGNI